MGERFRHFCAFDKLLFILWEDVVSQPTVYGAIFAVAVGATAVADVVVKDVVAVVVVVAAATAAAAAAVVLSTIIFGTYRFYKLTIPLPPLQNHTYTGISLVPSDPPCGCGSFLNSDDVEGAVALVERGECSFVSKAVKAAEAGAVAIVIADNDEHNDELYIIMQVKIFSGEYGVFSFAYFSGNLSCRQDREEDRKKN